MYFVFVDEAGQPGYSNKAGSSVHFTLAGMVVDGNNLLMLENDLACIKRDHAIFPDREFKWNSKYSEFGLTFQQYTSFRVASLDLICRASEAVIATAVNKPEAIKKNYINDHADLYKQALFLLMERVHYHISKTEPAPIVFVIDSRKNDKDKQLVNQNPKPRHQSLKPK